MTYYETDNGGKGEMVAESITVGIGCDDDNGDYVGLRQSPCDCEGGDSQPRSLGRSLWLWARSVVVFIFLVSLAAVFFTWVGPFFMNKEIIPVINWEAETFSPPVLAVFVFASVALFPSLLLPSSPSMWLAGMTFGYGFGFLLIISAITIGVSLPYFIGSLFYHKIQGWLEKYPKRASVLRLAGEGDCVHQFRAVALIRISPFPYILYNYCAVATNVRFGPYILGSLVGMVPEIFVTIYTGILIKTLADASQSQQFLSAPQIVFTVVGFCVTAATTVYFTVYAKRKLKELQTEDEQLLQ
ncbi:transmembrane protein 64-like [Cucurbita pepo subsp. pepo]|uniref:transmembrane protein 64-like n=1 Tax=Cucurbita pepo subsp. pepo TaxID=3664 RepID=UPI000C9DA4F1|nr:transmembrane protein 64-like [Cucurbita pepo subsp. pepo]